jgi:uncharacterized integral membrane protein
MSIVRKVEVLNKPYRFYGFTIKQILILAVAVGIAFYASLNVPNVKIQLPGSQLPLGFVVFMVVTCGSIFFVFATDLRPWAWWRNRFLYSLGIRQRCYMPKVAPAYIYPDANITEESKDKLSQPYYRETGRDAKNKRKSAKSI